MKISGDSLFDFFFFFAFYNRKLFGIHIFLQHLKIDFLFKNVLAFEFVDTWIYLFIFTPFSKDDVFGVCRKCYWFLRSESNNNFTVIHFFIIFLIFCFWAVSWIIVFFNHGDWFLYIDCNEFFLEALVWREFFFNLYLSSLQPVLFYFNMKIGWQYQFDLYHVIHIVQLVLVLIFGSCKEVYFTFVVLIKD